jgi:hypothetical protein
MDNTIIIILGVILLVLIILNHITIITTTTTTTNASQGNCSETAFGCCPNGVDSKINYYGTNCPDYRPGPGYYPNRPQYVPPPPPPPGPGPRPAKPIGGCTGTRYGCCPNNQTPKIDAQGSNCLVR